MLTPLEGPPSEGFPGTPEADKSIEECLSPILSSDVSSSVIAKKEAYSRLVQRVQRYSVDNYHRQPSKNIQHVSMTPSIFNVTVTIDEQKGIIGTGVGSTLKAAERQAMENLDRIIRLFEDSKDSYENCPVKDPSSYKSFESDEDKSHPWFAFVKNYVDSLSIMHTRQTSQIDECIEWDKRFWVTLKIDGTTPLYGKGVHTTKKKAIKLAAIVVALELDKRSAQHSGKPIEPAALSDYPEYLAADPDDCTGHLWFSSAKAHVHRIISKVFKKEAIFDVKTIENIKPTRYLAEVHYDENIIGKGQGLCSKEACRLASVDLCRKLWQIDPSLFSSQNITLADPPKDQEPKETSVSKHINTNLNFEDWKDKPKHVIHELFMQKFGKTPNYKLDEDPASKIVTSTVGLDVGSGLLFGQGRGPDADEASFNAAFDFCKKYFSKLTLGEKRVSDEDENGPKAKSIKKSVKIFPVKSEPLYRVDINTDFASWVFKMFNHSPTVNISHIGPSHAGVWKASISIWIHSDHVEGRGEGKTKKNAILMAASEFTKRIQNYDKTLYDRYRTESPKITKHIVTRANGVEIVIPSSGKVPVASTIADLSRDVEELGGIREAKDKALPSAPASSSSSTVSSATRTAEQPELHLVVSSEDRSNLLLVCDPRKLKSFQDFMIERHCKFLLHGDKLPNPSQTFPPEYYIQKSRLLAERQNHFYSSPVGRDYLQRRQSCPSVKCKDELLEALNKSSMVIVDGAVGCGMSSQIPLLILDNMIANNIGVSCNILVVVTSKVEAVSLADHLADQRGIKIGQDVGFCIGETGDCEPELYGSILFTTYSAFLRRVKRNPLLVEYSHVILDDISARSLEVDLSLVALREALLKRTELRLLINCKEDGPGTISLLNLYFASSLRSMVTLNFDRLLTKIVFLQEILKMFDETEIKNIAKRDTDSQLAIDGQKPTGVPFALITAFLGKLINTMKMPFTKKGILVMVPSFNDAMTLKRKLSLGMGLRPLEGQNLTIHLLHSNMQLAELMAVLTNMSNPNTFDLIISTDLIETGFVSCLDIVCVVDCGVRIGPMAGSFFATNSNSIDSHLQNYEFPDDLKIVDRIALQRRSRQSNQRHYVLAYERLVEGCVIECEAKQMTAETLVIRSMSMMDGQLLGFASASDLLCKLPEINCSKSQLDSVIQQLSDQLLCVSPSGLLTELGRVVSKVPLEPNWGKFLVACVLMRCLEAGLLICAAEVIGRSPITVGPTFDPLDVKKYNSDHFVIILAYNRWQEARPRFLTQVAEEEYCQQNGLDLQCLRLMGRVKSRLSSCLDNELRLLSTISALYSPEAIDFKECLNANGAKRSIVRGLLALAMPTMIAIGHGSPPVKALKSKDAIISISENSTCAMADVNADTGPGVFVFEGVNDKGKACMVSRVPAMAGALLCIPKTNGPNTATSPAAALFSSHSSGPLTASDWIEVNSRDSTPLCTFRHVLHQVMSYLASSGIIASSPSSPSMGMTMSEADAYAVRVLNLAISLIRHHSNFEQ